MVSLQSELGSAPIHNPRLGSKRTQLGSSPSEIGAGASQRARAFAAGLGSSAILTRRCRTPGTRAPQLGLRGSAIRRSGASGAGLGCCAIRLWEWRPNGVLRWSADKGVDDEVGGIELHEETLG
eukprot:11475753-Alexandrium_andersonii.AAC.1